ncbi:periplasmic binding protein-like I [Fimicolochytrium jonesii]|uniref:periplasmic binding protein-like I n=1 Tax=Fimicolochytrium jonesii TaxID=1396493 RepID=UPI0022FE0D4F|nr:periplasmic binding protein-like I [Fimicolochytrium jonesii]KAI8820253.1 periplasmic binding protein-like I [Fimicolochytrium jonesii]
MISIRRSPAARLFAAICLLLQVSLAICAVDQLKFSLLLPRSLEGYGELCDDIKNALDLFVAQKNAVYNTNNVNISLTFYDTQYKAAIAAAAVTDSVSNGAIGILGELASGMAGPVSNQLLPNQIMQCSGSTTAAGLNQKQYRYFFRTIPADDNQGVVLNQILSRYGWKRIGMIYADTSYGNGIANSLLSKAAASQVTVLANEKFNTDYSNLQTALQNVKDSGARIIVVVCEPPDYMLLVPAARKLGMYGPQFVWISTEAAMGVAANLRAGIPAGTYTQADLDAVNGLLISNPVEGQGALYDQFNADYKAKFSKDTGQYSLFFTDCLRLMLAGLENYQTTSGTPWSQIAAGQGYPRDLTKLLGPLTLAASTGLTGHVEFDRNFDRVGTYQVVNIVKGSNVVIGATTNATYNVVSNGVSAIFASGTTDIPTSELVFFPDWTEYKDPIAIVLMVLYAVMMGVNFASIALVYKWRSHTQVKALSPEFMIIMGLAMQLAYATIFTLIGEQTQSKCMARPWLYGFAFVVVTSCLIGKSYRLSRVFANKRLATPIGMAQLLPLTGMFALGELIILAVWTGYSPLKPQRVSNITTATFVNVCMSDRGNGGFVGTILGYNAVLLVATTWLAIATRNVPSRFSDAKFIALAVYSLLIWCTLIIAMSFIGGSSPSLVFYITSFGVLFVTTTTWALLIGRVVISHWSELQALKFDESTNPLKDQSKSTMLVAPAGAVKKSHPLGAPLSTNSQQTGQPITQHGDVGLRGLIAQFPVKAITILPWLSKWELFEAVLTIMPVPRLYLRSVTPGAAEKAYCVDAATLRVSRRNINGTGSTVAESGSEDRGVPAFEIEFGGRRMLFEASDEKQFEQWYNLLRMASKRMNDGQSGSSSVPSHTAPRSAAGAVSQPGV